MVDRQQLADSDMAPLSAPHGPSAPLSSATPADSSSLTPLAQSLSAAHSTLPKELFWQLLESTVLPHLERLPADQQQALSDAVEQATLEERRKQLKLYNAQLKARLEECESYQELHEVVLQKLKELEGLAGELEKERSQSFILHHATFRLCTLGRHDLVDLPPLILTLLSLSRHDFTRCTLLGILKDEMVASVQAIILARNVEFPYVQQALNGLEGDEALLEELPEVKLGEAGWQEKEKERRKREDQLEELLEMFARRVRPEHELGEDGKGEGEAGWQDLMEPEAEKQPSEKDRELGNTLYGWLEVWRAWPVRKEVERFGPRRWNLGGQGHLAFKRAVVTELCSLVSKRSRGYESRTTNLRDGMWVLMLAVCREDMGLGGSRIGYYY